MTEMTEFESLLAMLELERKFVKCPEISVDLYPIPNLELQAKLKSFKEVCAPTNVVVFVEFTSKSEPYLYIVILDDDRNILDRFVIRNGYRFDPETERRFLEVSRGERIKHMLFTDYTMPFNKIEKMVQRLFPQWHYEQYGLKNVDKALEHMYFGSHPCVKEKFYKSDLSRIAHKLTEIKGLNILGTMPTGIIPDNLPLRVLRIMNTSDDFVKALYSQENRLTHKTTYKQYASFLGKGIPSVAQWKYLVELENEGSFAGETFNRTLFNRLSPIGADLYLPMYKKYLEKIRNMGIKRRHLPKLYEVSSELARIEAYEEYGSMDSDDDCVKQRYQNEKQKFEYTSAKLALSVIMPESTNAFINETVQMNSCLLYEYLEAHKLGLTTIVFIRQNDSIWKPYVTAEIQGGKIKQVYAKNNTPPDGSVFRLLETYGEVKGLEFNPDELVNDYINIYDDVDVISEDLWKYLELYHKRHHIENPGSEPEKYIQLTFKDVYPDTFVI